MSAVPHTLEQVHFSAQTIYFGDCEEVLSQFHTGCADLVDIDPPFTYNRNNEVFWRDVQPLPSWGWTR